jgi:hypothetical protein
LVLGAEFHLVHFIAEAQEQFAMIRDRLIPGHHLADSGATAGMKKNKACPMFVSKSGGQP